MKNVCLTVMTGLLLVGLSAVSFGRPPYSAAFGEKYGGNADIKKVTEELKCNVCHFGKDKKNRNDYGKGLEEFFNKAVADSLKEDVEKGKKTLAEGFTKAEAKKAKDGATFGDRLKAGKAPGTPE